MHTIYILFNFAGVHLAHCWATDGLRVCYMHVLKVPACSYFFKFKTSCQNVFTLYTAVLNVTSVIIIRNCNIYFSFSFHFCFKVLIYFKHFFSFLNLNFLFHKVFFLFIVYLIYIAMWY